MVVLLFSLLQRPRRHVYPDGRQWEPTLRKLHGAGGDDDVPQVSLMQSVRLSDFLSTPSAARALGRAGARRA